MKLGAAIKDWGNEDWAANRAYLETCLQWMPRTTGAILECGTGLTTRVLSTANDPEREYHALEHDPDWMGRLVRKGGVSGVTGHLTPIKEYDGFSWYDVNPVSFPEIGLVICDGPPASIGRYGLMPVMRERLAPGCVILMDDANRELHTMLRWSRDFGVDFELQEAGRGIGVVTLR